MLEDQKLDALILYQYLASNPAKEKHYQQIKNIDNQ